VHEYQHCRTGGSSIDVDDEIRRVGEAASRFDAPYVVFAKSIGIFITLRGIEEGVLQPVKCMFVGVPLSLFQNQSTGLLEHNELPTIVAQNRRDPVASFDEVSGYITGLGIPNYRLVQLPGDNHHYEDIDRLTALIRQYGLTEQT